MKDNTYDIIDGKLVYGEVTTAVGKLYKSGQDLAFNDYRKLGRKLTLTDFEQWLYKELSSDDRLKYKLL